MNRLVRLNAPRCSLILLAALCTSAFSQTLSPVADAYVRSGTYQNTAFGATDPTLLKVHNTTAADYNFEIYLRFDLSSVANIANGKLRLYGFDDGASETVVTEARSSTNTTWSETTITWANKPAAGSAVHATATLQNTAAWHEWDVTSFLQAEKAAGRNLVTLVLMNSANSTGGTPFFNADENAANRPQLVLSTDGTAPTVAITAPANGATVTGSVAVSANASDNVGVVGVQFKLDGANLGTEDTASPYQIAWNTGTATPGSHTLTAVARDAAGNTTTSAAVNVTVQAASSTIQLEAESYSSMFNVTNKGTYIASFNNGNWICFNGVDLSAGFITLQARVACANVAADYGQLQVRLDSITGPQIAALRVLNTGGTTIWETQTAAVSAAGGTHNLYIVGSSNGTPSICNLDWIKLRKDMLPRGATVPFVTYEAEDGTYTGSLNGNPDSAPTAAYKYAASGRKYVHLDALNEYVQWTAANSGNRLTLRYGVAQNASGTISVIVNETTVHTVPVAGTFCFDAHDVTTKPRRFDEVTIPVSIAVNDTVKVKKTSTDTLAWYSIDLIDIEQSTPVAQPAGSLSITDYGAVPDDGVDDYDGIVACITAAAAGSKQVYIPAGTFTGRSRISIPDGVQITGAGMLETTMHFPNFVAGNQYANVAGFKIGINSRLADLRITNTATQRPDAQFMLKPLNSPGNGFTIERVKVQNVGSLIGWTLYNNAIFRSCRFHGTYFDGIHLGDGAVTNNLVENCFFRGSGDDAIAQVNANNQGVATGNVAQFNTIIAGYWSRNIANIGGDNFAARDNWMQGCYLAGAMIATETLGSPNYSRPIQGYKFQRNTILESSHTGHNHAGLHFWLDRTTMKDVRIEDCVIQDGETQGIRIDDTNWGDSAGPTQFNYNVVSGNAGRPGLPTNYDDASPEIAPILTGNTGIP